MENPRFLQAFGPHLVIDASGCRPELLADKEVARRFLTEAPDVIGMTKISPVMVMEKEDGVSGFVIIAESHITVHTFSARGELSIDLFSCKDFDIELAISEAKRIFGFRQAKVKLFDRGLEFPRDVEAVTDFVLQERQAAAM